jgi:hypothetical protein
MPRFIFPLENLTPPDINGKHKIRFRLRTEDANAISAWSNLFMVESVGQIDPEQVESNITALTSAGPFEIVWNSKVITSVSPSGIFDNELQAYDIFTKWNYDADFTYLGRVTGNKTTIYKPLPATSLRVIGQLPSHPTPTEPIVKFQIFDTGVVPLE